MNYYERHIGDYLKDTAHLSLMEHGVYSRLLDVYYTREAALPDSQVARLIGARTKDELAAMRAVLSEFFVQEEHGDWVQPRCEREIERYQDKQRKAAASANARWGKRDPHSDGNANASPNAMRTHSEGNAPSHQTPDTSEISPEANASVSSAARTGRPQIPCPYTEIVGLYHDLLPNLPAVRVLDGKTGEARKKAMREMWGWVLSSTRPDGTRRATTADEAVEWFRAYFTRATENDFVMGRTARGAGHEHWRADLDYLLSRKGLTQVLEKTAA